MYMMFITPSANKWYLTVTAIIFTVIAIAHLGLIILQMPAVVGGYAIPLEINGLVVVMMGYLATRGFMAANRL
jgi:hypothetical protein